jgi:hypothetical protein
MAWQRSSAKQADPDCPESVAAEKCLLFDKAKTRPSLVPILFMVHLW